MSELFPEAGPGFDDPLGLLHACHQRILDHLDTLQRLAEHLAANGVDKEAEEAARKVHRYFSTSGKFHHQDEEQDLFPRLIRQSLKMADLIHGLKKDHQEMERLWNELDPLLNRPGRIEDVTAFSALVVEFQAIYRRHIATENNDLLALAQHILSSKDVKELGKAMAKRRGVGV